MSANGDHRNEAAVLHWTGRLLTADDLRGRLNGERAVVVSPRAVVTPLALDELRAKGIRIVRQDAAHAGATSPPESPKPGPLGAGTWGFALERPDPLAHSVIAALECDGVKLQHLSAASAAAPVAWARALAECIARGDCAGAVAFCQDAALVSCVANKVGGLRAAPVASVAQAARAALTLGANLIAVETAGRTFFELRHIVKTLCAKPPACPAALARVLEEVEHAHR